MLVEYKLPLTSKRADVVLAGVHPRTGEDSYVVVELKQWSRAEPSELGEHLVIVDGMPGGETLHPAEQVRRYCEYMRDFLRVLNGRPDALYGAAYLHNAMDLDVDGLAEQVRDEHSRLFTKQRRGEFLRYLSERLSDKPGTDAADGKRVRAFSGDTDDRWEFARFLSTVLSAEGPASTFTGSITHMSGLPRRSCTPLTRRFGAGWSFHCWMSNARQ
jgi:hypothetical protein